jgi:hypothetical protein
MPIYMVERDLPGITTDALQSAQQAAIAASRQSTANGSPVRYLRSTFVPGESRCMCLFEAATPEIVRQVNDAARIPYFRVAEALCLEP